MQALPSGQMFQLAILILFYISRPKLCSLRDSTKFISQNRLLTRKTAKQQQQQTNGTGLYSESTRLDTTRPSTASEVSSFPDMAHCGPRFIDNFFWTITKLSPTVNKRDPETLCIRTQEDAQRSLPQNTTQTPTHTSKTAVSVV